MNTQTTSNLIMIRPAAFGYNTQTAENNTFQHAPELDQQEVKKRALEEFDALVKKLKAEGVHVDILEDSPIPVKPDAIFPNNWVSFHADGRIVTYPMFSPLRRQERRNELLSQITREFGFNEKIEFEEYEAQSIYLEGTGSMVLDRVNKVAYACISPRTNQLVLEDWCEVMEYTPFMFAAEYEGKDIYHTNVMMAIGDGIAAVGLAVVEPGRREALRDKLVADGHDIVELTARQIGSFAGNMLAVRNNKDEQLMVMSQSAFESLTQEQIRIIESHARIVYSDVHTIESVGGGSVRCMIAENFLPAM